MSVGIRAHLPSGLVLVMVGRDVADVGMFLTGPVRCPGACPGQVCRLNSQPVHRPRLRVVAVARPGNSPAVGSLGDTVFRPSVAARAVVATLPTIDPPSRLLLPVGSGGGLR